LKEDNMTQYRQVCMDISTQDEKCLQDVLEEVLEKIDVGENQF